MNILTGDNKKNRTGSRVWQSILITLYHSTTKIGIFLSVYRDNALCVATSSTERLYAKCQ